MKQKLNIFCNLPAWVMKGEFGYSLRISSNETCRDYGTETDLPLIWTGELDLDIDHKILTQYAIDSLDTQETEARAEFSEKLRLLEEERQTYLAITHSPTLVA